MYEEYIRKLYKVNLNANQDDSLLILTDTEKNYLIELLQEFEKTAYTITKNVRAYAYDSLKGHGKEPNQDVWTLTFGQEAINELNKVGLLEKIINKDRYNEDDIISILKEKAKGIPTCVVAFAYFSTTHTFYRKVLTDHFGVRYVSMPLFNPDMFLGPMDVDWDYVSKLSMDIADIITEAEWVHVKDALGTNIEFSIENRKGIPDTGLFHKPGDYGNLPAGEAFVATVETSAYGSLCVSYGPDRRLQSPIILKFKDGSVENIEGKDSYKEYLESIFYKYPKARHIAEFGVGTNPKAKKLDNVLEAEKILGTIHIAIGDNASFGGTNKVPFHTDYVVFEPYVTVGGKGWQKILLERGNLRNLS